LHRWRDQSAGRSDELHGATTIKRLSDLRERVEAGKWRAEIIDRRLIVSPLPVFWHELARNWLFRGLRDACAEKGWMPDQAGEIKLPATNDLIEPDLMVLRDEASLQNLESTRPLDRVLLVAEIATHSSIREDREIKPLACALAGVPHYLVIDRFTTPMTVSLFSAPGDGGYARIETVCVGRKLRLPEPFDVTLDTASLPSRRRGDLPSE